MKFTWTIDANEPIDTNAFIQTLLSKPYRRVTRAELERLGACVARVAMSPCLRKLYDSILRVAEERPSCPATLSSLIELVAGIEYAATDATIGRLHNLRLEYGRASEPAILWDLRGYAAEALRTKQYRRKECWFHLRIRVMDAFALCVAYAARTDLIIYYAGSKHTEYFASHLVDWAGAKRVAATHSVLADLPTRSLTGLQQLHWRNGTVVLLGEHHGSTEPAFADALLNMLKRQCKRQCDDGRACTFMIERHLENANDYLQQTLMCNIPSCALHRTRCDSFFRVEKNRCAGLRVYAVDTRHVDCGFLRREVLDAWDVDATFRKTARRFQKKSLRSIIHFVDAVLTK